MLYSKCREFGHFQFNSMKNQNKTEKVNNQTKNSCCVKPIEATEGSCSHSSVSMATKTAAEPEEIPEALVVHCFYIENDNSLLKQSGEAIVVDKKKYIALRDTGSQISIAYSDLIAQDNIIPDRTSLSVPPLNYIKI